MEQWAQLGSVPAGHGVDLVDVSSGGLLPASIEVAPGYQVPFARNVPGGRSQDRRGRDAGRTASGLRDPAPRHADVVFVARAALREPYWPLRVAHKLCMKWREVGYPPAYTRGAWDYAPALD